MDAGLFFLRRLLTTKPIHERVFKHTQTNIGEKTMKLLTKAQEEKLIANFQANQTAEGHTRERGLIDHKPVVKLFGGAACTWLLTEYNPEDGLFFGLCDLGQGFPELGYVSRQELEELRFPPFKLPVERDMHFEADKTIGEYADIAKREGRIVS